MMKIAMNLFFLLFSLSLSAQKSKPHFTTLLQGGLLEGERGSAFQVKAINGIAYRTWTGGLGVGLDYYHTRTVPVFLDVRKSFGKSLKAPFVYASGGVSFPWVKTAEASNLKHNAGLYMDAGMGYQFLLRSKSFLFFSAGYSQKEHTQRYYSPTPIDYYPWPSQSTYKMEYSLRRLSVQAGLRF